MLNDKNIEKAVEDMLKSRARSLVYIYLLRHNGSITQDIIQGTKLHPSTVRELLSKMFNENQIYRKKLKKGNIGKNPYLYFPASPIELLKRHTKEIEDGLNKIANLPFSKYNFNKLKTVKINIEE
jgi:predicted DNA-binding transcriptional regulator